MHPATREAGGSLFLLLSLLYPAPLPLSSKAASQIFVEHSSSRLFCIKSPKRLHSATGPRRLCSGHVVSNCRAYNLDHYSPELDVTCYQQLNRSKTFVSGHVLSGSHFLLISPDFTPISRQMLHQTRTGRVAPSHNHNHKQTQ